MEAIEAALKDAVFFEKEKRPKEEYYKVLDGIFSILDLLERYYLYRLPGEAVHLTRANVQECLEVLRRLVKSAELLVSAVCELTADAATSFSRARTGLQHSTQPSLSLRMNRPSSFTFVSPSETQLSPALTGSDAEAAADFEDPVPVQAPDEPVPLIPTSLLDLELGSVLVDIQLIMQKISSKFGSISAKPKSNAAYLSGLQRLLAQLEDRVARKLELEHNRVGSSNLRSKYFAPAMLALQLTLLDARLLATYDFDLLIEEKTFDRSLDDTTKQLHRYLEAVIKFEVLAPKEHQDRVRALFHWIQVAQQLLTAKSYGMYKTVADALTLGPVKRAGKLKAGLSSTQQYELRKLEEKASQGANYKALKQDMEAVDLAVKPIVPFVGPYITDIAMLYNAIKTEPDREKNKKRRGEIDEIVQLLKDYQSRLDKFTDTIEPDQIAQHWLLSRTYKNSLELENLATTQAGGGVYSPTSETSEPSPPQVLDIGDEGKIMWDNMTRKLDRDIRRM